MIGNIINWFKSLFACKDEESEPLNSDVTVDKPAEPEAPKV